MDFRTENSSGNSAAWPQDLVLVDRMNDRYDLTIEK
jgi:hypothetical protein